MPFNRLIILLQHQEGLSPHVIKTVQFGITWAQTDRSVHELYGSFWLTHKNCLREPTECKFLVSDEDEMLFRMLQERRIHIGSLVTGISR